MSLRALIISWEYPPFKGGVGVVAENIFKCIANEGVVLTSRSSNMRSQRVYRVLPNFNGFFRYLFGLVVLIYYLLRFRTNKIIAVCPTSQRLCLVLSYIFRVKYVCIVHGSEIFWNSKPRLYGLNLLSIYKRSVGNFAVSNYVKSLLEKRSIPNISRFYLGLGASYLRPIKAKIPNSIVSISRLDRRKGHREILRALAIVRAQGIPFHYTIAGEGADADYLRMLSDELSLTDQITFLGGISEHEKYELLGRSEIYVLHSLMHLDTVEGYGISYLEAGIYCNLVIGSNHGGVPEALDDLPNSIIIQQGNISELANALAASLTRQTRIHLTTFERTQLLLKFKNRWQDNTKEIMIKLNQ